MQQGLFWGYLEKIVKYIFVSPDNKTTAMEMEHFVFITETSPNPSGTCRVA